MADQLQVIQEQVTTLTRTVEYVQTDMQTLKGEIGDIKQELKSLREGQIALRTDMAGLTAGFEQMDKRFGDFSAQVDKRFGDFSAQVDKRFGDLGARVTSVENWLRWGVGILLLSWLTLMTSIWLK